MTKSVLASLAPDTRHMVHLATGQARILELIVAGCPLSETSSELVRFLEQDAPEMFGSVLLLDDGGIHLRHCAAPSLPAAYAQAVDGQAIGPMAGSCGTAAWRRERVIVEDVESDPLWEGYRALIRPYGLRACWSTPILDAEGRVLGTFALYFREPGRPTAFHERIIATATHVAAIAIQKEQRERALYESDQRSRLLSLATNDAVWDWDIHRNTLWWNDAVERLFGYPPCEVRSVLSWWTERVHADDRERVRATLQKAADDGATVWREEYRFRRRDGDYAHVQDRGYLMRDAAGHPIRMIGMMQDITERTRAEAMIRELAYHEPVTRLPNRAALQVHMAEAIEQAATDRHEVALLLANVNGFRDINDTLGHQNGDLLLRHVADRLRASLPADGHTAALGGDEFAILLPRLKDLSDVEAMIHRVHDSLQAGATLAAIPVRVDVSLGVAVYPQHGATADLLWQHADIALRTAKERHERCLFYRPEIDLYDPSRLMLLGELGSAIEADQLVLHYQPKIDLRTGRTAGVEALVRWAHPERGLIYPDEFIPLAERTGLINPLTSYVVTNAIRQGLSLLQSGLALNIAVNLSARNLHDPDFCRGLLDLVRDAGFPTSLLTFEITESAIMGDYGRARAALEDLRQAGIELSIDDFGIGQSSLAYLRDLPTSQMKIDRSFVLEFEHPRNAAVVRSAIDLGRNMGLEVTAEGVDSEQTCRVLRELGCDMAQGWLFSKALSAAALTEWLRDSPWGCGPRSGVELR